MCVRWEFPELTTPTPSFVVKTVDTNVGKVRLVNEGVCQDPMSGRVEVTRDNVHANEQVFDANGNHQAHLQSGELWLNIVEPRPNEWLTVGDDQFGVEEGTNLCKTMFGPGAKVTFCVFVVKLNFL